VAYDDGAEPGRRPRRPLRPRRGLRCLVLARLLGQPLPRDRRLGCSRCSAASATSGRRCCYFTALERISAGLTALLLYVFPALVVVLSAVLLRERPRPLAAGCVALALAGTALTIGPVQGGQSSGVALGLGSALVYAVYILTSSRVTGVGAFAMAAVVLSAAAVCTGALAAATRPALPSSATAWLALVGVALLGTVVAVTAFFGALALIGPSDASVLSTVEPVVSVVSPAWSSASGCPRRRSRRRGRAAGGGRPRPRRVARRPSPRRCRRERRAARARRPATWCASAAGPTARPETGRHHHIGAAPELQPVLGDDGSSYVGTSQVQLAARTVAQLQAQAERLRAGMAAAAADLRFEDAAALRDDLGPVEAELAARRLTAAAGPLTRAGGRTPGTATARRRWSSRPTSVPAPPRARRHRRSSRGVAYSAAASNQA
jgi:hypothetical protein